MLLEWTRPVCKEDLRRKIRRKKRPRLRWINNVEDHLRKLGVKRWRTKALHRVEWTSIVRETKAKLKGP
jgi:hypothetical protein